MIKYLTLAELERFNEVSRERRAIENRKSLSKFFGEKTPCHSRSRSTSVYKMPDNTPTKLTMTWNHEIWDDEDDWYVRHAARQGMEPLPLVEKSKLPKSTTCKYYVSSICTCSILINYLLLYLPFYNFITYNTI